MNISCVSYILKDIPSMKKTEIFSKTMFYHFKEYQFPYIYEN
ncbi:hypothetical protein AQPE_1364 [Aquipluma nitroreducens]|jgi:hypothetical protein|uniref:Uncharacterized protein n=1 Tax=Aquipluma nitroreducens TaxID=2010828 RepID=A0A5K7S6V7_9BACT|nr:hypothetical protein AQPE_1364 [Aquipluma nitroreducens]